MNLNITKNNVIEFYPRVVMPLAIKSIKSTNTNVIIVSHNIMNELNFLHLELIKLGYPVVHNCKPFKDNGLYYDDTHELNAIDLIHNHHSLNNINIEAFNKFSSNNDDSLSEYMTKIDNIYNSKYNNFIFNIDNLLHIDTNSLCNTNEDNVIIWVEDDISELKFRSTYNYSNWNLHLYIYNKIQIEIIDLLKNMFKDVKIFMIVEMFNFTNRFQLKWNIINSYEFNHIIFYEDLPSFNNVIINVNKITNINKSTNKRNKGN